MRFEVLKAVCVLRRHLVKNSKTTILLTVVRVEGSFFDLICCHIVRLVHLLLIIFGVAFLNSFTIFFFTGQISIYTVLFFHCKVIPCHHACSELVESTHSLPHSATHSRRRRRRATWGVPIFFCNSYFPICLWMSSYCGRALAIKKIYPSSPLFFFSPPMKDELIDWLIAYIYMYV